MAELNKALLPYGTTSSSPAIVLPDTELFLSERGSLTKNYFENAVSCSIENMTQKKACRTE